MGIDRSHTRSTFYFFLDQAFLEMTVSGGGGQGDSHMKVIGVSVGNFEKNP